MYLSWRRRKGIAAALWIVGLIAALVAIRVEGRASAGVGFGIQMVRTTEVAGATSEPSKIELTSIH